MKAIITGILLSWLPMAAQHSYSEIALLPYGSHFCVEVVINGHPCHLIVDTGSAYSFLHKKEIKRLGCKHGGATDIILNDFGGGHTPLFSARKVHIKLNNQVLPRKTWYVLNNPQPFPLRNNIQPVGILGIDILHLLKAKVTFGRPAYLTYSLP